MNPIKIKGSRTNVWRPNERIALALVNSGRMRTIDNQLTEIV